jgi:hypothetical protein
MNPVLSTVLSLSKGPVEGMNGHCPQCHYHRPEQAIVVVVRITCPICHYIEQGRRSPVFRDPAELVTWLNGAEEQHGCTSSAQSRGQVWPTPNVCRFFGQLIYSPFPGECLN